MAAYDARSYFPDTTDVGYGTDSYEQRVRDAEGYDPCIVDHANVSHGSNRPFDAIQHLFPYPHSYLTRRKEDGREERLTAECLKCKRYVIICTFHIPVTKNSHVATLCCDLRAVFSELAKEKHDSVVVLVARMRSDFPEFDTDLKLSEDAFNHFFSAFSPFCLAVPILDSTRSLNMFRFIGSSKFSSPGCAVANLETRQLLCIDISHTFQQYGPDFYPFTNERLNELGHQDHAISFGKMPLAPLLRRKSSDVLHCHCGSNCGKNQSLANLSNKVVWLYYLYEGDFMDKLCELYHSCKADSRYKFELLVVCAKSYPKDKPMILPSWEDNVQSQLRNNPLCCGWYYLPYDYIVGKRLESLCVYSSHDKLVVYGPNSRYVDPDGKEMYLDYGIGAYPFTKEAVWDMEVARLRGLSLYDWLSDNGIRAFRRDGHTYPLRSLQDTDVIVYFGWAPLNPDPGAWERHLPFWLNQMKLASKRRFEVISVCSYVDTKLIPSLEMYCSSLGMLFPVPHEEQRSVDLVDSLFGKPGVWGSSLAAFDGSSGRLLRLTMERTLQQFTGPATFPRSDDALRIDVGILFNSQMGDDMWFRALDTAIEHSFSQLDVSFVV